MLIVKFRSMSCCPFKIKIVLNMSKQNWLYTKKKVTDSISMIFVIRWYIVIFVICLQYLMWHLVSALKLGIILNTYLCKFLSIFFIIFPGLLEPEFIHITSPLLNVRKYQTGFIPHSSAFSVVFGSKVVPPPSPLEFRCRF